MKSLFTTAIAICVSFLSFGQNTVVKGLLQEEGGTPVIYANIAVYTPDSTLVKVETTDGDGKFSVVGLAPGTYTLQASYVGLSDFRQEVTIAEKESKDLGVLTMVTQSVQLAEATVTAQRAMVEIKPDRTVFNVQGTINSTGDDAISLLRKAPGVIVDNNDNLTVLGRSGVLIYMDGKRLPLTGDDLSNFLRSLPAEQIDRIDIISNPGAKYEAEGNAGIIDIRMKKDKNLGYNGSVSSTYSQGRMARANISTVGNYRNKKMNIFGSAGVGRGGGWNEMEFINYQNGFVLDEVNNSDNRSNYGNLRLGTDFFLTKEHTIGFLAEVRSNDWWSDSQNRSLISNQSTPEMIDSILIANNEGDGVGDQQTFNVNYRYETKEGRSINVDLDYGHYDNDNDRLQPNLYFDAGETMLLTDRTNRINTPTTIDIYTAKIDFEDKLWGGKLGLGSKFSRVESDNTFLFFNISNQDETLNDRNSNIFNYDENVYAGYISYARPIGKTINVNAGLRAEQTDAMGVLTPFLPELQEDPVDLNYLSWFPSAGITWQVSQMHMWALNYGRRINRPDYNILNPFRNQLSELSYERGNAFLRPEIVNNVELGYTYAYRYNFKLSYSRTLDQITRLIGPDEDDPRAGFISWDNLATQTVYNFNISAPMQFAKFWNAYFNLNSSYTDNQADYGENGIVDVQAFSYNIYTQQTFTLPKGYTAEVSGWFSGPGVWGGVFEYNTSWSLNLGLQKKFMDDKLNVRLSVNDIFFQSGWNGSSEFNGLVSVGAGNWDSRRASISLSYNFGNDQVKRSRRRSTGLEDEADRVKQD